MRVIVDGNDVKIFMSRIEADCLQGDLEAHEDDIQASTERLLSSLGDALNEADDDIEDEDEWEDEDSDEEELLTDMTDEEIQS